MKSLFPWYSKALPIRSIFIRHLIYLFLILLLTNIVLHFIKLKPKTEIITKLEKVKYLKPSITKVYEILSKKLPPVCRVLKINTNNNKYLIYIQCQKKVKLSFPTSMKAIITYNE